MSYNNLINQINKNYFFETFKKFGATDEQIESLNKRFPSFIDDAIKLNIDDKLNIAYIFGIDIDEVIKKPYFLFKPLLSLVLKCEIALLEGLEPDIRFIDKTKHRHLFSNYSARKKRYLPTSYNVLIEAQTSAKKLRLSKNNYINKFYKDKNISDIHLEFKTLFPEFYNELIKIDEYKMLTSLNEYNQDLIK